MSSIKKNFIYNSLYQLLALCIPLITTPYISRVLGADGIGVYSFAYSISHFFVIFIMLGLNNYGCREIAKARDDKKQLSRTFWSIYSLQIITGVVFNLLYIGYCFAFAKNKTAALLLGFYTLSACFDVNWLFFGLEKFKFTTIRNTLVKLLSTLSIFIFVKTENDVFVYCLILSLGFLISQLILWPSVLKNIKFVLPNTKEIFVHLKPNLLLFVTTISVFLFKYMDKIMLGAMATEEQLGFYQVSEGIISIPIALIAALGTIMLPRMTNLISKKSEESNKLLHISILFAMLISSSLCFGIMGIAKEFVPLFYGPGYDTCVQIYLILLPSCLFLAFANVVRTQYLLPHQMDRDYVISAVLGAIVNLVINVLLITHLGAIGVSLGTLVAELFVCLYQSIKVGKCISLKRSIYEIIPLVVSGAVMFVILYLWDLSQLAAIFAIAIKVLVGAIIYFVVLFLLAFLMKINYYTTIKELVRKN